MAAFQYNRQPYNCGNDEDGDQGDADDNHGDGYDDKDYVEEI